jgi:hypothetical protein
MLPYWKRFLSENRVGRLFFINDALCPISITYPPLATISYRSDSKAVSHIRSRSLSVRLPASRRSTAIVYAE